MLCPESGTQCITGDTLEVLEGYWMSSANQTLAYSCPRRHTCLGGSLKFGDESCMHGHSGHLCGQCEDGFYRGRFECLSCAGVSALKDMNPEELRESRTRVVAIIFGSGAFAMVLILLYLLFPKEGERRDWVDCVVNAARRFETFARKFVGKEFVTITATLFKILLSYMQCLGAINRFSRLRWPQIFVGFVESLDVVNFEFLSMFPAECITGSRLGFFWELVIVLIVSLPACHPFSCSSLAFALYRAPNHERSMLS